MKIQNIEDIRIGDSVYKTLRDNRQIDGTITCAMLTVTGIDAVEEKLRVKDYRDTDNGWMSLSVFELL